MLDKIVLERGGLYSLEFMGNCNFHIRKARMFTGDDNYKETDSVIAEVNNEGKFNIFRETPWLRKTKMRLRYEPAVEIEAHDEEAPENGKNPEPLLISLVHHKGSIYLTCE